MYTPIIIQGLDLSAMVPTILTFLTAALKNTNVDFTKVIARLTLSVRAISNVAIRIVNWRLKSQAMPQTGKDSTVATMVCQSGKSYCWFVNNYINFFFCLEQRSLSCHVPNLEDLTVKKCEQEDSPCIVKKIGKSILSHFTRVLCMQWG